MDIYDVTFTALPIIGHPTQVIVNGKTTTTAIIIEVSVDPTDSSIIIAKTASGSTYKGPQIHQQIIQHTPSSPPRDSFGSGFGLGTGVSIGCCVGCLAIVIVIIILLAMAATSLSPP